MKSSSCFTLCMSACEELLLMLQPLLLLFSVAETLKQNGVNVSLHFIQSVQVGTRFACKNRYLAVPKRFEEAYIFSALLKPSCYWSSQVFGLFHL